MKGKQKRKQKTLKSALLPIVRAIEDEGANWQATLKATGTLDEASFSRMQTLRQSLQVPPPEMAVDALILCDALRVVAAFQLKVIGCSTSEESQLFVPAFVELANGLYALRLGLEKQAGITAAQLGIFQDREILIQ